MAEFDESKHPRDKDGKFTDKNKTSASKRNETFANALNLYTNTHKNPSVTKKEWRLWYDAIGDIELGVRYEPTKEGKTYIPIGNKVFVTSGTYSKPRLEMLIEFDNAEEIDDFIADISSEESW